MKPIKNFHGITKSSPRIFTFNQLSLISDENYKVLNRCIDMSGFNPSDIFVLTPVMIHEHSFGEPAKPHLRTLVTKLFDTVTLAFQDLTFEQWEQGVDYQKIAS